MSDESQILTIDKLTSLIGEAPPPLHHEVTVSLRDHFTVEQYLNGLYRGDLNSWLSYGLVAVYIDPTLQPGEWYWGRPDPERLGETYKDWAVPASPDAPTREVGGEP